jgi:hypothetical protein
VRSIYWDRNAWTIAHLGGPAKVAEMGVRHFLPKPYNARTVVTTLQLVLNETSIKREAPVKSLTLG